MVSPFAGLTEQQIIERLADPFWRLRSLYWVKDKRGKAVPFRPWPEQEKFLDNIWYRNVIPKARQRGFSTVVQLMMFDACLFVTNNSAAVIAQDEDTALRIFDSKIKFAWDHLPPLVREMVPRTMNNKHEMQWANGSSFYVDTSTRGGTLQYLHVSEYGLICAKFPERATEVQEGALPSVDQHGIIVVESTVESPFGQFAEMVKRAEAHQQAGRPLTPLDYRLHFASWWDADEYELDPTHVIISSKDAAYFERAEAAIGQAISPAKRAWYVTKRDADFGGSDEKMWRQYPTTLKEAFTVSSEGLWLSQQLAKARVDRRIGPLPLIPGLPVNTWWDLGVTTDSNCCWLHQEVGPWDHFVGYLETSSEPYSTIVRMMQVQQSERGFVWGTHYLPHDGNQTRPGAEALKTPMAMFSDLGLRNIEIVPRILDTTVGIEQLREAFPRCRFDEQHCAEGITHLEGFSKVWNNTMALWSAQIAKNGHQHAADALRQYAQMAHLIRATGGSQQPRRRNRSGMAV